MQITVFYKMKQKIAQFLIVFMLLAQIGLAQHASVHFTDHGHIEHHQEQDDEDRGPYKNAGELCQIFLSAKSFSHGLVDQQDVLIPVQVSFIPVRVLTEQVFDDYNPASYHPRGPPSLLI